MSVIKCSDYNIYLDESWKTVNDYISNSKPSKVFVLLDENTTEHCLQIFHDNINFRYKALEIRAGEIHKTIDTCKVLWSKLLELGADRKSILINLGGGVVGDLGGFVASCFMRGIPFIQMPTSLLSQVDASVGGKLGVDHEGIKNMIGVFQNPQLVFIKTEFLKTLPFKEMRSGYAEVIKHAIISSEEKWNELKNIKDLKKVNWTEIVEWNVQIKKDIVQKDFKESGKRKLLNFGHTVGHAIESANLNEDQKVLHGEAIAIGMIIESYLAHFKTNLEYSTFMEIKNYILSIFDHLKPNIENQLNEIVLLCQRDKKNQAGKIMFSLPTKIGNAVHDIEIEAMKIKSGITAYLNQIRG